jgi:hypothetical protein
MPPPKVTFRTAAEALQAVFDLPSDPEQSDDDIEGCSGTEADTDDDSEGETVDILCDDSDDDDILYRLATSSDSSSSDAENSDQSSHESDCDEKGWAKTTLNPVLINFDAVQVVPQQPFTPEEGPSDFLGKFLDSTFYEWLVDHTNLYAEQKKTRNWQQVTAEELRAFVGILIAMGLHAVPSTELFWSTKPLFRVQHIADIMPIKRFKKIREVLHANDNSKTPRRDDTKYDKLYKVRPLIDQLNVAFMKHGVSSSSQSVDEAMIKFKGRSSIKQYMPMKPIKRGYKAWVRSDSRTGYLYQFDIYTGKADSGAITTGLGSSVVLKLCDAIKHCDCHVAFDNFFSSRELLEKLLEDGIYATATARCDRKDLPVLARQSTNLRKGEYEWRTKGKTSYIRWKDTKDVHILSTTFNPATTATVQRTQKDGSTLEVSCPEAVREYTKRMGGVDRLDERRGRYSISRRSRRWWLRIFYFVVDCAIVNAFVLFKSVHPELPITMLQFREQLFLQLVAGYSSRKRRTALVGGAYVRRRRKHEALPHKKLGVPDEIRLRSVGVHWPEKSGTFRRCRLCSTRQNNKRSRIICSTCGVALCITPCFADFHQ